MNSNNFVSIDWFNKSLLFFEYMKKLYNIPSFHKIRSPVVVTGITNKLPKYMKPKLKRTIRNYTRAHLASFAFTMEVKLQLPTLQTIMILM